MFDACKLSNADSGRENQAIPQPIENRRQSTEHVIVSVSRLLAMMLENDALECSEVMP